MEHEEKSGPNTVNSGQLPTSGGGDTTLPGGGGGGEAGGGDGGGHSDGNGGNGGNTPAKDNRAELLLKMYDQMFNDINRHILVVWQSVGVLIGAFAIFALAEKNVISVDIASALVLLISGWLLAHLIDAGYWYNRNLVIIANIERQFLKREDLREIHYYFGKHRPNNKMLTHLRIQFAFGVGIGTLVVLFHLSTRVLPGVEQSLKHFEPVRALPYLVVVAGALYLWALRGHRDKSYSEFLTNSPGTTTDITGIEYGIGHGHPSASKRKAQGV